MRRLVGYKVTETLTPVSGNYGTLNVVYISPVTITENVERIFSITYNYTRYSVIAKKSGYTVTEADILALGMTVSDVIIEIEANASDIVNTELSTPFIQATGTIPVQITDKSFMVRADSVSAAKQFSSSYAVPKYVTTLNATITPITVDEIIKTLSLPFDIEIDNQTAIGLNFSSFDLSAPEKIGISYSNTFTIPKTAKNDMLHGFFGRSDDVYSEYLVDYYIGNEVIVSKAKFQIDTVTERISCSIFAKDNIWDTFAQTLWVDFMQKYYGWLASNYSSELVYTSYFQTTINQLGARTEHFKMPLFFTESDKAFFDTRINGRIMLNNRGVDGGHLVTYAKSIFQFIESEYGVSFFGDIPNNIFTYKNPYIQNPYLVLTRVNDTEFRITFLLNQALRINSEDKEIFQNREKKSILDFIKYFLQHTNSILDQLSSTVFAIRPFDIIAQAPLVNFSGMIEKNISFSPLMPKIAQTTIIDFQSYSELIQKGSARIELTCENRNAPAISEYYTINGHIPAAIPWQQYAILAYIDKKSREEFTLMEDSENTINALAFYLYGGGWQLYINTVTLPIAQVMEVPTAGLQAIILKPKVYKIKKWLNFDEIKNIRFFQRYWVKELGGSFYINSIKGLNPEGSKQPTDIELILIDREPVNEIYCEWFDYLCELIDA